MRRRKVITTGIVAGLGSTAGCMGGDEGGNDDRAATPTPESTPEPPDEPEAGEVTYSVEPPTDGIDWGDEYTVTVTAQTGEDPPAAGTFIVYGTEESSMWTGGVDNTEKRWKLDAGESQTETFEIEPPSVGEFTFGLTNSDEEVVDEWELNKVQVS